MYVTVITVIKIVPFNSMFIRTVKGPYNLLRFENFFTINIPPGPHSHRGALHIHQTPAVC